jgi:hypothetical protein
MENYKIYYNTYYDVQNHSTKSQIKISLVYGENGQVVLWAKVNQVT